MAWDYLGARQIPPTYSAETKSCIEYLSWNSSALARQKGGGVMGCGRKHLFVLTFFPNGMPLAWVLFCVKTKKCQISNWNQTWITKIELKVRALCILVVSAICYAPSEFWIVDNQWSKNDEATSTSKSFRLARPPKIPLHNKFHSFSLVLGTWTNFLSQGLISCWPTCVFAGIVLYNQSPKLSNHRSCQTPSPSPMSDGFVPLFTRFPRNM